MINISNSLYISQLDTLGDRPLIGWQSIVTTSNLSATSELTSRPLINMWNPDTNLYWESDTVPSSGLIYIYIENSLSKSIDYLGIARHNFGSAGIEYTLQESDDDITYTDVTTARTPSDDRAIVDYFDQSNSAYYRIELNCGSTAPIIGHIKLGASLILQRPMYVGHKPETLGRFRKSITNVSDTGQYLGQVVVRRWQRGEVRQQHTDPTWVREVLQEFIKHVALDRDDDDTAQGPFFFAWRPADYPLEVIYGWTDDEIQPNNQMSYGGLMEYGFNVTGLA